MSAARLAVLLACALAKPAAAQGVRDLALAWVQGDFRAPLVCIVDGVPRQALRRVLIHPGPRSAARPSVRVSFYDLEAPPGTSCSGIAGEPEPNVIGALELVFDGRSRPDTGEVDFRNALRRDGGFTFKVESGRLRVGPVVDGEAALRSVDFEDGRARIGSVAPASDAARRLASFGNHRQLRLELHRDGAPPLAFDLIELPPR
jgi:hypothetical protein